MKDARPISYYVLATADARMVTCDTRTGPALTTSAALCYVWSDPVEAEAQRQAYEGALGVNLAVQPRRQQHH